MRTGSLRTRVILTTLSLLAVVLVAVIAAVTLIYRATLRHDLSHRLTTAAAAAQQQWPNGGKQLLTGLALEGIATDINTTRQQVPAAKAAAAGLPPIKPGNRIESRGSLLELDQTLPDGTQITYTASQAPVAHAVKRLLTIEVGVGMAALALAALLLLRGAATALRPLTARRIAAGERSRRLRATRTDTELGGMAAAFDHMVDALDAAIARAEAAESSMRVFLADASHELRTPIAALQANAETLLREQPDRPERDQLEANLARDAARLGRLVNDLLALTRLESDNQPQAPVNLAEIAAGAINDAGSQAPDATITLADNDTSPVSGDTAALARLLRNLLDNALAAGATNITLHTSSDNGTCELAVQDNGPGIPEDEQERIFERFTRLDHTRAGHGLGLAIARRIAQQHHGTLTCDPTPQGARFTLRLPRTHEVTATDSRGAP